MNDPENETRSGENRDKGTDSLVRRYPWAVFIIPFLVFMLLANIEPQRVKMVVVPGAGQLEHQPEMGWKWLGRIVGGTAYPLAYSVRLFLTIAVMLLLYEGYRQFPWKISPLSIVVGVVGIVLWVGLCKLNLEQKCAAILRIKMLESFLESGERTAYNPFEELSNHVPLLIGFLLIRFVGLAAVVPVIEEFFLRGFIVRILVAPDWSKVSVGHVSKTTILVPAIYGFATHPAEAFAAIAWFSLVTWLAIRTNNIWDCVMAHAVTNFLLGLYVIAFSDWALW